MISRYSSDILTINPSIAESCVRLAVSIHTPHIRTHTLPHTSAILSESLPSVLKSQCFNDKNLPFHKEVEATEVGHLFEHIILAYMCDSKLDAGHSDACFNGYTEWDWNKNQRGTYDVIINVTHQDMCHLKSALEKSIVLTERILSYS